MSFIDSPDRPRASGGKEAEGMKTGCPSSQMKRETKTAKDEAARSLAWDDPNRPETEEDGIRAEAIRREQVRRLTVPRESTVQPDPIL
jgi:hypothetical protein